MRGIAELFIAALEMERRPDTPVNKRFNWIRTFRMIQTPIEKLQPGMILNQDVLDRSGRLLAKAHTKLTEKHITILKTWGIAEAHIKGAQDEQEEIAEEVVISAAALEQASEIAQYLFSRANRDHPAMQKLYELCVKRMARQLSTRGG